MDQHKPFVPPKLIELDCLYTFYYFEFACGYLFPGEQHDFWEMVYIDRGEADIGAGDRMHRLRQGQIIFHQPNEFHSIWANAAQGTNILVVTFASRSPAMDAFRGRLCTPGEGQRHLIARMVREAQHAFGPALDLPRTQLLHRPDAPAESAQLVQLYLTQLLLELHRTQESAKPEAAVRLTDEGFGQTLELIASLMRSHLDGSLHFEEICRTAGLSSTVLKERFKRCTGFTVMDYYQRLRLEESRRMLRQGRLNIGQVAAEMGYSSPQAFSRQFKRIMGISPMDYLKMIRN